MRSLWKTLLQAALPPRTVVSFVAPLAANRFEVPGSLDAIDVLGIDYRILAQKAHQRVDCYSNLGASPL